MYTKIRQQR